MARSSGRDLETLLRGALLVKGVAGLAFVTILSTYCALLYLDGVSCSFWKAAAPLLPGAAFSLYLAAAPSRIAESRHWRWAFYAEWVLTSAATIVVLMATAHDLALGFLGLHWSHLGPDPVPPLGLIGVLVLHGPAFWLGTRQGRRASIGNRTDP